MIHTKFGILVLALGKVILIQTTSSILICTRTQFHILVLGLGNVIWCYLTTLTMTIILNPNHSTRTEFHILVLGLGNVI